MTEHGATPQPAVNEPDDEEVDQDSEPTMMAPPEDRPTGPSMSEESEGRADTPDVVDTDESQ